MRSRFDARRPQPHSRCVFLATVAVSLVISQSQRLVAQSDVDFTRDVRPILLDKCVKCHGPDEEAREAELRLDIAADSHADRGGYHAIKAGNPAASSVYQRVTAEDPDERMPPPDSGLVLSQQQVEILRQWIEAGGVYQPHWSFRPITRPAPPEVAGQGPIDAFIQARLSAAGLAASPAAERYTLIRRVSLDILGLLPAPAEVDRFLADDAPGAYERMVDRTLASPHFGERWGRHWLDQARYADTNGYTIDSERSIWPYRDWVIDAINEDMPFDRFTVEQLAGDLLESPGQRQLVATGFHRNTLVNQEGGTDREQFRNEAVVDRVNTTAAVWLGLTAGCAQCHTHKYDPLTHREYYGLFAFFNSGQDVNSVSPTISVPTPEQAGRLADLDADLAAATTRLMQFDRARRKANQPASTNGDGPVQWHIANTTGRQSRGGASLKTLADGSILAGGTNPDKETYHLTFRSPVAQVTALRLEALTHPSLPQGGPGRAGNGNFVLNEVTLSAGARTANWIHATADHSQPNYAVAGVIDGDSKTGWAINGAKPFNVTRTATLVTAPVPTANQVITVTMTFAGAPAGYNIGRFRLAVTDAPLARLDIPDPERAPLVAAVDRAKAARTAFARNIPSTMVMRELGKPRPTHVLVRGDFLRRGDPVAASVPAFLPDLPTGDEQSTRLDLARWLVDARNPLTARVTVNRIWMRLFGRGLVETENDFGLQGTPPTHPELLDWLAAEYRNNGWSLRHLLRRILVSSTYRQSSVLRSDGNTVDPLNKLLWRQQRVRVDAEIVRDLALSASGLLDRRIGGRGVYPPQPKGVYAFTQRRANWPVSKGGDRYRRGMYTFFMRSAPHPLLTTFDAPAFNTTCTRRVRSNTPLQSLTVANEESFVEAAQALARRVRASGSDDAPRLRTAFHICFSRDPDAGERERLLQYLDLQRRELREQPDDAARIGGFSGSVAEAADQASWTMVARVLLNLDEFITRE